MVNLLENICYDLNSSPLSLQFSQEIFDFVVVVRSSERWLVLW